MGMFSPQLCGIRSRMKERARGRRKDGATGLQAPPSWIREAREREGAHGDRWSKAMGDRDMVRDLGQEPEGPQQEGGLG